MIALLVLGCCFQDPEPGGLRWPFQTGKDAFPLLNTYGQFVGDPEQDGDLHFGIDVIPGKPGEEVRALEPGTIRRIQRVGIDSSTDPACTNHVDDQHCGLVIESDAVPGRAFLYLHLEESSLQDLREGQHVAESEFIGQVLYHDTNTGVEHLHLARVAGAFRSACWEEVEELSVCNPLRLFRPESLADSERPQFAKLAGYTKEYRFRVDDDTYVRSSSIRAGDTLDLVVRTFDLDGSGSGRRLAPYRVRMDIASPSGTETRELRFDGELRKHGGTLLETRDPYSVDDKYHSVGKPSGKNKFYVQPTNAGADGIDVDLYWSATSGQHVFAVRAFDLANNESLPLTFSLDVLP